MREEWWQGKLEEILIAEERVQNKVSELAERISEDYQGRCPILVGVMRGAGMFHADLIRRIRLDLSIDFISVSSYGDNTHSSGEVQLVKDLETAVEGEDVILVEDIVDTGLTLAFLLRLISARNPASLKVCSFLSKPSCRRIDVGIDYLGFEIPDRFVVGYGLDYQQKYRNLPFLAVLRD
jgi:hypoxanthine phosphoribosyltransferase